MVPGMNHCSGGEGAYLFDALSALIRWREEGVAPQRIVAHKPNALARTHPLCPYPQEAIYKGSGDTGDEASYTCGLVAARP
jgi:feruloyl esterase